MQSVSHDNRRSFPLETVSVFGESDLALVAVAYHYTRPVKRVRAFLVSVIVLVVIVAEIVRIGSVLPEHVNPSERPVIIVSPIVEGVVILPPCVSLNPHADNLAVVDIIVAVPARDERQRH
ncbi:MAG: hypothetical protein ACI4SO_07925 [Muribaculaceae bacterium]